MLVKLCTYYIFMHHIFMYDKPLFADEGVSTVAANILRRMLDPHVTHICSSYTVKIYLWDYCFWDGKIKDIWKKSIEPNVTSILNLNEKST